MMRDLPLGIAREFESASWACTESTLWDKMVDWQNDRIEAQKEYNRDYRASENGKERRAGQRARARACGPMLPNVDTAPPSRAKREAERAAVRKIVRSVLPIRRRVKPLVQLPLGLDGA